MFNKVAIFVLLISVLATPCFAEDDYDYTEGREEIVWYQELGPGQGGGRGSEIKIIYSCDDLTNILMDKKIGQTKTADFEFLKAFVLGLRNGFNIAYKINKTGEVYSDIKLIEKGCQTAGKWQRDSISTVFGIELRKRHGIPDITNSKWMVEEGKFKK